LRKKRIGSGRQVVRWQLNSRVGGHDKALRDNRWV
jgi:hypothetical protein